MRFRINPIVKKDLQVAARSMKLSWGLFAYEAVLACAFLLTLLIIQESGNNFYSGNTYSYLISLFPVIAITQICIVALIVPILTASSISGEKERQTFDIMLTTSMSPLSIVFGKVVSAVLRIMFFVVASTPIMALAFVVGGLSWLDLLYFMLTVILMSVFWGSIGIFCSSICRKAISAVILSFVFYFVIHGLTFMPMVFYMIFSRGKVGDSVLALLFNPIMFYEEFFMQILTGESIMTTEFSRSDVGIITYYISKSGMWMFISAGCILLFSFLFMLAAAWRVNPLHSSGGKVTKKKD